MNKTTRNVVILFAVLLLMAAVASLWAQDAPAKQGKGEKSGESNQATQKNLVTRIFPIKYVDTSELQKILQVFPGGVQESRELKVISWTGPAEIAPAVEEAIKRIDVAPAALKGIDSTFYLLVGSKNEGGGDEIPPELAGVTKQLQQTFGYKSFVLWDTIMTRCVEGGKGTVEGLLPARGPRHGVNAEPDNKYEISYAVATLRGSGAERIIRYDHLFVRVRTTVVQTVEGKVRESPTGCSWSTSVEVKEGQKAVIGKANTEGDGKAIFLVVMARVME